MLIDALIENAFLLQNIVVWAILLTATASYALLIGFCLGSRDMNWRDALNDWSPVVKTMLAALPLLGLLGTISGLMSTFGQMSSEGGFQLQEAISGGVAEAMFTTQLGLVLVVPGLVAMGYLSYLEKHARIADEQ
ncbi:biopolymer transport protein ExbB [Alteromonadaceae bacterium Bs31]|nr:biopolymer transport protein ExbB [Alteromonadaceae bacterium Bs31]